MMMTKTWTWSSICWCHLLRRARLHHSYPRMQLQATFVSKGFLQNPNLYFTHRILLKDISSVLFKRSVKVKWKPGQTDGLDFFAIACDYLYQRWWWRCINIVREWLTVIDSLLIVVIDHAPAGGSRIAAHSIILPIFRQKSLRNMCIICVCGRNKRIFRDYTSELHTCNCIDVCKCKVRSVHAREWYEGTTTLANI